GEHRARDRGGNERARRNGLGQLLHDDDELLDAETRAAVRLRDMEAKPAEIDDVVPHRRHWFALGFEQFTRGPAGLTLGQELRRGAGKSLVVLSDRDRHAQSYVAEAVARRVAHAVA